MRKKNINDNYDRKELLKTVSDIFGEKLTDDELKERTELWELADHTNDPQVLAELSASGYLEVRESVASNSDTPVDVLITLLSDESAEVRQTAVLNPNTPLSAAEKMCVDKDRLVREAVIRRKKSEG